MKAGDDVQWVGQLVIDKRSESVVYTGTVQHVRAEGQVVVRIKTPEREANRLVVGVPNDFGTVVHH